MNNIKIFLLIISFNSFLYSYENSYDNLTFSQAADLAVTASMELKEARAVYSIKEGVMVWGIKEYLPRFSVTVSENDRLQEIGSDSFIKNYGVNIDQLIWDGGQYSLAKKLERMELNLYLSGLDKMINEITENAISVYRSILSSRAIVGIKEGSLKILEGQRQILKEEVQLGLVLPIELANADINLSNEKIEIMSLKLDLIELEKQFAELLGLDSLPVLAEKIDVKRNTVLPAAKTASSHAKENNSDLTDMRFSITKKEMELRSLKYSWIPNLRLIGSFGVTGQRYPLTRYNWSVGINIDFNLPWIQNRFAFQTGIESPNDKTAMLQNNFNLLPDPASGYGKKQAYMALALEHEKYNNTLEKVGRTAGHAVEKCLLVEQKKELAMEAAKLGTERLHIEEIRLELGLITRLNLMELVIEQAQKEITVVEAAIALLEAERELERFLNLKPGELASFANRSLIEIK